MDYSDPSCFISGKVTNSSMDAGYVKAEQTVVASAEAWKALFASSTCLSAGQNLDSYGKFASEGGGQMMDDDGAAIYKTFTQATTWTKDESWAYDYSFLEGELTLPSDLPDGVYKLDVYKGEFVDSQFLEDFQVEQNGKFVEDLKNGTLPKVRSSLIDVQNSAHKEFESVPLVITVGNPPTVTTESTTTSKTTTSTSTTTSSSSTVNPSGIVYDLVPASGEYTFDGTNNVVEVGQGDTVTVNWTVKNDEAEVGGLEYTLDISKVASVANAKKGTAYRINPTINTDNAGQITYVWASKEIFHANDGAVIMSMDVTVPSIDGEYTIGLKSGETAMTAGHDVGVNYTPTFHGITFKVGAKTTTTETTTTGTTTSSTTTSTTTTSTTTETTHGDQEVFWGDSNCDKQVSIADVVLLNRHLAGTAKLSDQGAKNADVVFNNKLEPSDSKVIKGYLALLIKYEVMGTANAETTLDAAIAAQK
jgi:hypothetical protein